MTLSPPGGNKDDYGTLSSSLPSCTNEAIHDPTANERPSVIRSIGLSIASIAFFLAVIFFGLLESGDRWHTPFHDNVNFSNSVVNLNTSSFLRSSSSSLVSEFPDWPELTWQIVRSDDDTEDVHVGYLLVCDSGTHKFAYRRATNASAEYCSKTETSPVIRMTPGQTYKLVVINRSSQPTNVHTHGLHVSGVGTVDDVTRSAEPGTCLVYIYKVLDSADVGTFWYHSHRHPLTANQVIQGAHGMLIVEETPSQMSRYPAHIQSFFANEVLFQYTSHVKKTSTGQTHRINTINGQSSLSLQWKRNQWYYVRVSFVIIADAINYIEFVPHNACEVRPVAYDGVYRSSIPHPTSQPRHMLTTSSRVDLAVRCHQNADIYFHQGSLQEEGRLVSVQIDQHETKTNNASPYWNILSNQAWKPRRPYYMDNLSDGTPIDFWSMDMDKIKTKGKPLLSINQHRWDPEEAIRSVELGTLVEWELLNTAKHPLHIHINRMQTMEDCGHRYEVGEYFDSIASSNSTCRVRIHFRDFGGRVVAHCHKLNHEDKGMMVWLAVTGGLGEGVQGAPSENCLSLL